MKISKLFWTLTLIIFLGIFLTPSVSAQTQNLPASEAECRNYCANFGQDFSNWDSTKNICACKDKDSPSSSNSTVNIGSPWGSGPETVEDVIENVTNWVLGIAGSLAVLFIIISGIRYITSAGNQAQHEAAKKNLTSAIIGLVIVLISFVIVQVISRVLTNS